MSVVFLLFREMQTTCWINVKIWEKLWMTAVLLSFIEIQVSLHDEVKQVYSGLIHFKLVINVMGNVTPIIYFK